MKKTTKGALAAGAAAVLLAGGAGTYAAWSDSETASGGSVTTGELSVTQTAAPEWTWVTGGAEGEPVAAEATLVPGDTISFEGTYDITVVGTNLEATLEVTLANGDSIPGELVWTPAAGNEETLTGLTEDTAPDTVTAGGTLTFPDEATGTMNETVDLGDITVTLRQTAPAQA